MLKAFTATNVVSAKIVNMPDRKPFVFAQNGDDRDILCHRNQGGRLEITVGGNLVWKQTNFDIIQPNSKIALVRESVDPKSDGFTRAKFWFPHDDWWEFGWAVDAKTVYRAVGFNHQCDGCPQSNANTEVTLEEGKLIDLVTKFNGCDPFGTRFNTTLAGKTLSCEVRWYRKDKDESWTECACPKPLS